MEGERAETETVDGTAKTNSENIAVVKIVHSSEFRVQRWKKEGPTSIRLRQRYPKPATADKTSNVQREKAVRSSQFRVQRERRHSFTSRIKLKNAESKADP